MKELLKKLRDQRNKLMHDGQALMLKENITAEDRAAFDQMMSDADVIEGDIQRAERTAKFEEEQRSIQRPPRPQPGAGTDDTDPEARAKKEKRAFEQFIRYGHAGVDPEHRGFLHSMETRDLGQGAVGAPITGGAQFVPQAFYPVLTEAKKSWGDLVNIVNIRQTDTGAPMKYAFATDVGNLMVVLGEAAAPVETDPTLAGGTSSTDILTTGVVKVSIAELQDSAFDIDAWLRNEMGKRYYRGLSSLMVSGSGSGNIQSIVTGLPVAATFKTAAVGTMTYADIAALYAQLDPAYLQNANWTMSSTIRGIMLGMVDTLGRPIFVPSPSADAFDRILGRPVVLNQYADSTVATGKNPIQLGDFSQGYMLRLVNPGLAVMRLTERYADTLEVGFIGYCRAGGLVTDAGTHPIITLQVK